MNCRRVQNLLPDYSVDALSERERRAVRTHLGDCDSCRAELRALEAAVALVEEHAGVNPPPGLFNAVRHEITRPEFRRDRPNILGWAQLRPVRALAMAGAVAALALSLFSLQNAPPGPDVVDVPPPIQVPEQSRSAIAAVVRQHALSAAEGPLGDRVAWEAMAQLADLELRGDRATADRP